MSQNPKKHVITTSIEPEGIQRMIKKDLRTIEQFIDRVNLKTPMIRDRKRKAYQAMSRLREIADRIAEGGAK